MIVNETNSKPNSSEKVQRLHSNSSEKELSFHFEFLQRTKSSKLQKQAGKQERCSSLKSLENHRF